MPTAILVDGGFFLKRYQSLKGNSPPQQVAKDLHVMCLGHLTQREGNHRGRRKLYRIFFYDCPPLQKKVHNPITKKCVDFSKSALASWRLAFHNELRKLRKVALRLGYLADRCGHWDLKPKILLDLLSHKITMDQLKEQDVGYDVRQKGVDMRIGLDIASMAYKKHVDQIVLVAGDSDFVPAAKLARREGIDFILDPMWAGIRSDLHEHIDGLCSLFARPKAPSIGTTLQAPPIIVAEPGVDGQS